MSPHSTIKLLFGTSSLVYWLVKVGNTSGSSWPRQIFLAALNAEQENRRLCGKDYQQPPYVFKWPDGRPFSPDYVSRHFAALLHKHGLPHIRFHELRHSCASLLLSQGMTLKDVQEWLGHSDIKMTANVYGHLDIARKQSIADTMGSLLSSNSDV